MSEGASHESSGLHSALDKLFWERFVHEVDSLKGRFEDELGRIKTKLDTNSETLYRLSRDVSDLREDVAKIEARIAAPVQAYDRGVFTGSLLASLVVWAKPLIFSALGAAVAWWLSGPSQK